MAKYIFFIDVDNTLIKTRTRVIDKEVVSEIKKLREQGHIFVLTTGRTLQSIKNIDDVDVVDFYAPMFGSLIINSKNLCCEYIGKTIDWNLIDPFISFLQERGVNWEYKTADGQKTISQNANYLKRSVAMQVPFKEFESDLKANKIIQLFVDAPVSDEDCRKFEKLSFFRMPGNYTDVSLAGADKSQCINFFRKKLKDDFVFVAIGDSENDVPMFKVADISIAMANAIDDVKKQAMYTTTSVDDNGVVYAFKNILGILD